MNRCIKHPHLAQRCPCTFFCCHTAVECDRARGGSGLRPLVTERLAYKYLLGALKVKRHFKHEEEEWEWVSCSTPVHSAVRKWKGILDKFEDFLCLRGQKRSRSGTLNCGSLFSYRQQKGQWGKMPKQFVILLNQSSHRWVRLFVCGSTCKICQLMSLI